MQDLSRFLERNAGRFDGALWINPPPEALTADSGAAPSGVFCQHFGQWRQLQSMGVAAQFGDFPAPDSSPVGDILLILPRGKARLRMMLAALSSMMTDGARLWLAGENRSGIRSATPLLAERFGDVEKVDSARHCSLLVASAPRSNDVFDASDWQIEWTFAHRGKTLQIRAWPGVFSHGELDSGTALLLDAMPDLPPSASVLDFGCGAGVIGVALGAVDPTLDLTLVDADALARRSSRASLAANGLTGHVIASNGFSELSGIFDVIVTNPPFHESHRSDPALSPSLLAPILNFLAPGGQLIMVANRHLPYRPWLERTFGAIEVLQSDNRYQVITCRA